MTTRAWAIENTYPDGSTDLGAVLFETEADARLTLAEAGFGRADRCVVAVEVTYDAIDGRRIRRAQP